MDRWVLGGELQNTGTPKLHMQKNRLLERKVKQQKGECMGVKETFFVCLFSLSLASNSLPSRGR